jgi:L-cysteine:1D-myo-inositol 2-amino-2-deoxy-alpha-D-glucopyranoside ligase
MLALSGERGGDPARPGKRDALDPLLWRAARAGEPSWDGGSLGQGRPGWHVECSTIAVRRLGMAFDVQGGGTDLVFPHHEMSAAHAGSLTGDWPFARCYVHQGMVGFQGHKMSKSRGNLVLVSQLRREGRDPMAIRLALLAHHYRSDWEFTFDELARAEARLERWRAAFSCDGGPDATATVQHLRECLADDLRTPDALSAVDRWSDEQLTRGGQVQSAPGVLARAVDALLGVRL